jgi:hypothetical protein
MNELEKRKLLAEYVKRQGQRAQADIRYTPTEQELVLAGRVREQMFVPQRAFFSSPARRKVGWCTRRAGKTIGSALEFIATLLEHPNKLCLYMAQTREMAKLYMWKELKEWTRRFGLEDIFEFNENQLWMIHKRGGGKLTLRGSDTEKEVDKLRGAAWQLAILDESSTFGAFMEELVVEVIGPALRDHNGTLILIGTAGRNKSGLFYEACHGLKRRKDGTSIYELHKWSLIDNPELSEDAKDLELIKEEEGLTEDDPRFLREYKMIWASSDSERVWPGYDSTRNDFVNDMNFELPREHRWKFLLGMDFGWQDESGIAVIAYSPTTSRIYCLETWAKNHAFSDEIATKVFEFRGKYGARRYVGDIGGQGKIFQQQLQRDYHINVEPARKMEKQSYIEFMNSALFRGDLMIAAGDGVGKEFLEVAWDDPKAERKKIGAHEKDNRAHACFSGNTLITTSKGFKRIDEVRAGDRALTRAGFKLVTQAGISGVLPTRRLTLSDGRQVTCTDNHPFYTQLGWVRADALTLKHELTIIDALPADQRVRTHVVAVTLLPPEKVYNLSIQDNPEYLANGILVHNCMYGWRAAAYVAGKEKLVTKYDRNRPVAFDVEKVRILNEKPKAVKDWWDKNDSSGSKVSNRGSIGPWSEPPKNWRR